MARLLPPERDIGVLRTPIRATLTLVGVFLLVLLSVALMERMGVGAGFETPAVVSAAFVLFALAALIAHSRRAADFYVADRRIPGPFGGLAAAGSFGGLVAIGLVGGAPATEAGFLMITLALAAGHLVPALLIAPRLRRFGAYTTGDFLAARFGGSWVRLASAMVAFTVSFLLLLAQLKIAAPLLATLFGIAPEQALVAAAGLTMMAALPGGMRSMTWTQAVQYFVVTLACMLPAAYLTAFGPHAESFARQDFAAALFESLPHWNGAAPADWGLPLFLAVIGVAALPHISARALAAPSPREAGTSMAWAVLFSAMLLMVGIVLVELLRGAAGVGSTSTDGAPLTALFATLPAVLGSLVLAGTIAALFALGQAALFSAATAISHDIYDETVDRRGPEGRRIIVARLTLVCVATAGAAVAPRWQAEASALVAWALALAAAGSFVPLVFGLWWRRCNEIGAVAGTVAGFGFTGLVFLLDQNVIPDTLVSSGWAGVGAPAAAAVGLLMSLVVTVGLSLVTPAPEADIDTLVEGGENGHGKLPIRERPA